MALAYIVAHGDGFALRPDSIVTLDAMPVWAMPRVRGGPLMSVYDFREQTVVSRQ